MHAFRYNWHSRVIEALEIWLTFIILLIISWALRQIGVSIPYLTQYMGVFATQYSITFFINNRWVFIVVKVIIAVIFTITSGILAGSAIIRCSEHLEKDLEKKRRKLRPYNATYIH